MPRTSAVRSLFPLQAERTERMCSWMTSSRRIIRTSRGWGDAGREIEPRTASRSGACRVCWFARSNKALAAECNWGRLPCQGKRRAASIRSGASSGMGTPDWAGDSMHEVREQLRNIFAAVAQGGITIRREPRKSASSGEKRARAHQRSKAALREGYDARSLCSVSVDQAKKGGLGDGRKLVRLGDIKHAEGCESIFGARIFEERKGLGRLEVEERALAQRRVLVEGPGGRLVTATGLSKDQGCTEIRGDPPKLTSQLGHCRARSLRARERAWEPSKSSRSLAQPLPKSGFEPDSALTWLKHRQPKTIFLGQAWCFVKAGGAKEERMASAILFEVLLEVKVRVAEALRYRLGAVGVEGAGKLLSDGGGGGVLDR